MSANGRNCSRAHEGVVNQPCAFPSTDRGVSSFRKPRKAKEAATPQKFKVQNVVWTWDENNLKLMRAHKGKQCLVFRLKLGEGRNGAKRTTVHAKQHYTKI